MTYTIKALEQAVGVKAHTIRMWEKRYGLLKPTRTDTNIRVYNDDQLRKLLNVSSLLALGSSISAVSSLTEQQINDRIGELMETEETADGQPMVLINNFISASLNYDETLFEQTFSTTLLRFGFEDAYKLVLHPLLVRIGMIWRKDDMIPTQEHFLTSLIKRKICSAIDAIETPVSTNDLWVLFLAEHENHEIGLLFTSYILRSRGKRVIYLGQKVPLDNLKQVVEDVNPTELFMFLVLVMPVERTQELINNLEKLCAQNNYNLIFAGSASAKEQLELGLNTTWVASLDDFTAHIEQP